jgi:DNA polymerase I-like protein with 3'-5' exonuclease and polymerase domains
MEPWLRSAAATGGLVYTFWSSTRTHGEAAASAGASTGRLASTPNLQNIPKRRETLFRDRAHPDLPPAPLPLPALPRIRSYVVPRRPGHVLIDRDYSQHELRILAHYEAGALLDAYLERPWLDFHANAQRMINAALGTSWGRRPVKNAGFGLLYGMGVGTMAAKNRITVDEARELKAAYLARFPGLRALYQEMRRRAALEEPIRTWGSRLYYCEAPRVVKGRLRRFDYKMLNLLIQGSAADLTKEAIIRYEERRRGDELLLLTVHDELLASVPRRALAPAMARLRDAMEFDALDVPMLSEGKYSVRSWDVRDLRIYDRKGRTRVSKI